MTGVALLLSACGDGGGGSDSDASTATTATTDSIGDADAQPNVQSAADLTPEQVCDLISPEELVAVVEGELTTTEPLDGPPQCAVNYANNQAVRDQGGANGTNLLVAVPTSDDLEGKTGNAGITVASQYAFNNSEPTPVDIADGGLSDGKYLYFANGGRVVTVVAGDGMTPDQLIEVAQLVVEPLAP